MNFRLLSSLIGVLLFTAALNAVERPLVVLITSYNNKGYADINLKSVLMQRYTNYRIIYVDDCSSDGTDQIVQRFYEKFFDKARFLSIRNKKRVGALANIYNAVHSCKDEEIIVSLDGDDWFANPNVLQKVNEAYAQSDVWLTHGSLILHPNRATPWSIPIPQEVIDSGSFRAYRAPSHLRTFYAWLFKLIRLEDLQYEGAFFPMAWDQAMMFPMIEMAGERHRFIKEVLYVYNVANAMNDNKVDPQLQLDLEAHIRSKPSYLRLDK